MSLFTGIDGIKKEVKTLYTGIDGIKKEVKTLYTGIGGVMKDLFSSSKLYLYNRGDECSDVTGGWNIPTGNDSTSLMYGVNCAVTKNSDNIYMHTYRACIATKKAIDLSAYKSIHVILDMYWESANEDAFCVYSTDSISPYYGYPTNSGWNSEYIGRLEYTSKFTELNKEIVIDFEKSSSKYISIYIADTSYLNRVNIKEIWLEK